MTNKTLLVIHAVIYEVFAILLFFFPDLMWPLYGVEINDQYAQFLSQHNSIFLGGLGIMCWLLRDLKQGSDIACRVLLGLLGTNGIGVVITLYACFKGIFFGFGWTDPAFFALLTILCFVQIKKTAHKH